jgi:hypothetical protein
VVLIVKKIILLNILYTFHFEIIRCFSLFQNRIRLDVFYMSIHLF